MWNIWAGLSRKAIMNEIDNSMYRIRYQEILVDPNF